MVATADAQQRALMSLRTLELMVRDLPDVAADWDHLSEGERESWSLDWGNEMAALPRLAEAVADGALDPHDRARYDRVVRTLADAGHMVERLRLRPPAELIQT